MEKNKFFILVNEAKGLCHVNIEPPEWEEDDMTIEFLEGPLKGSTVAISNYQIRS